MLKWQLICLKYYLLSFVLIVEHLFNGFKFKIRVTLKFCVFFFKAEVYAIMYIDFIFI